MHPLLRRLIVVLLCGVGFTGSAWAGDAATAWRLLDYLAVDYGGAVADGKVVSPVGWAERSDAHRGAAP